MEPATQLEAVASHQQTAQRQYLQGQDDHPISLTKQDRSGFDPDLQVVIAVDHGVVGVVTHGPQ
ncbi:hypothetical protein D3C76_1862090 [compost metagenome]